MNQVKFSQMKDGGEEDYELLIKFEDKLHEGTAERIIRILKGLESSLGVYKDLGWSILFKQHQEQ